MGSVLEAEIFRLYLAGGPEREFFIFGELTKSGTALGASLSFHPSILSRSLFASLAASLLPRTRAISSIASRWRTMVSR